jgi:hypothetical protein
VIDAGKQNERRDHDRTSGRANNGFIGRDPLRAIIPSRMSGDSLDAG